MTRGITLFLIIAVCPRSGIAQTSPSGLKHYGPVCGSLTGDTDCKVCASSGLQRWACYSHKLEQVPDDAKPLSPEQPQSVPASSDVSPTTEGTECWSSKFDEITDANIKISLSDRPTFLQKVKQLIVQSGGIDEFVRETDRDIQRLLQDEANGLVTISVYGDDPNATTPPVSVSQLVLLGKGMIEVAECLTSEGSGATAESSSSTVSGKGKASPDCKALAEYRDTQLVRDFDVALKKNDIFHDGVLKQKEYAKETATLMDKQWWAGETGAEIAVEVKFYADMINDVIGTVVPVESTAVHFAQSAASTVDIVKVEEEQGAKKAAGDALMALDKELAARGGSFLGIGLDAIEHEENEKGLAAFKQETQERVQAIDRTIQGYETKMDQSRERAQAISDIVASIDRACGSSNSGPDAPLTHP